MESAAAKVVFEELKLPVKYTKPSSRGDRVEALVNRLWLRQLIKTRSIPNFIFHDKFSDEEVSALFKQGEAFTTGWEHITLTVIKKEDKLVIPLPRVRPTGKSDTKLSLSQILHYVAHTNHKNLWKEAYKKYNSGLVQREGRGEGGVQLTEQNTLLREVISRLYGVSVVRLGEPLILQESTFQPHPNLLPALTAVETSHNFIIIQERKCEHSLQDCVTFSPALLSSCYAKPLLIIYQLLRVMRQLHGIGLVLGDITLHDIAMTEDLWIQVIPRVTDNIYDAPQEEHGAESGGDDSAEPGNEAKDTTGTDIGRLAEAWVAGAVSNYDYLCELNRLAGRRIGDPQRHYVLPWVSDLASRSGANFRDLTKSKFRLNKGERQLDLTYQLPPTNTPPQVPHHVPDVLSEITYYVYLSRITPRSVLCKYVRPQWVPAEYPVSIQRLYEWTPDECIPEFFTDPSVFKSIHSDLGDLEVPSWAGSAQEFIAQHRAALESQHVSERLHHWIDLTFGYKLSGLAAVKAKNVCLQLVDGHTRLTGSGVVQLFGYPHPHRLPASPYWSRTPPRIHSHDSRKACTEDDDGHSSGLEDEEPPRPTPLSLSRLMSRSRSSLITSPVSAESDAKKCGGVALPKEYNPVGALAAVEALHGFTSNTLYWPSTRPPHPRPTASLYKQLVAARRATEMQVLGCLIVEMVVAPGLRVFGSGAAPLPLPRRLYLCRNLFRSQPDLIPRCLRHLVSVLLKVESEGECVTELGTPPPSAHQLLQPLLTLVPFPKHFPLLYNTLATLQSLSSLQDPSESKVKSIVSSVESLAEESKECLQLLLPYITELLNSPHTDVIAAWYLFDHIARGLGPRATTKELLESVVHLYDWDRPREPRLLRKRVKLYHRSFLLRLIVRFGLAVFLESFVPPLVEAVGGYHDIDQPTAPSHLDEVEEGVEADNATPLSPLDEDSLAESDRAHSAPPPPDKEPEPEVFLLEEDSLDESQRNAQSDASLQTILADSTDAQSADEKETEEFEIKVIEVSPEESWNRKTFGELKQFDQEPADVEYSKVREVAGESVVWLAARLGPVLSARALSRNLLRMLALCYAGPDNLTPSSGSISSPPHHILGDENAHNVLRCLSAIAGLYGEQLIVVQYLPHMADLISLCKRKITTNLEGGLIGCLVLLSHVIDHLSDTIFAEILQDVIVRNVIGPSLRLLASCSTSLPNGVTGRRALAYKLLAALTSLVRTARPQQRIPLLQTLQRFFLAFSKAHQHTPNPKVQDPNGEGITMKNRLKKDMSESPPLSFTPCDNMDSHRLQILGELKEVLNAEFAYIAFVPFANFFGDSMMEQSLRNYDLIKDLCMEYMKSRQAAGHQIPGTCDIEPPEVIETSLEIPHRIGSFSNVVLIGNRIDLQESTAKSNSPTNIEEGQINRKMENSNRHLRGNWLAYWEHEIGRSLKDTKLNVKQIKLQGFAGHSGSVRHIVPLTSENSFMSGGRDKTVRLWSLRSQGDGGAMCGPQWSYSGHRKGVTGLGLVERSRLVASCDSGQLHLWDPFVGRTSSLLDLPHTSALLPLPPPSTLVLLATPETTVRSLDARTATYVNELKVSLIPVGVIRCMVQSPNSNWLAVGHASGVITILDLKMGTIIVSWKAHDAEILQLVAVDEQTLISSSLDQSISVWNTSDGKLKFILKGPTEPVHCLEIYGNEVISGTTANRVGVHTGITSDASFSSTRLRSDTLRGVLTAMAVLPLNRLLLLGSDTGSISLIC